MREIDGLLLRSANRGDFRGVAVTLAGKPQDQANIDVQDPDNGCTALMYAAIRDDFEMAKLLVEKGADVFIRDHKGHTAWDHAAYDRNENIMVLLHGRKLEIEAAEAAARVAETRQREKTHAASSAYRLRRRKP